jgi:arylsulfatase A-like enzyme
MFYKVFSFLKFVFFLGFFNIFYAQQSPNILFILTDDLGYGDLGCYGATDVQTPHIDSLAQKSVQFTRAYANSTVCSPSRASILTGNYPDMVGVPGVVRDMPDNTWGNLKDNIKTLPGELQKLNYNTALIGKWHLGYKSPDLPNDRGFDYFKGFVGDMMDDYHTHLRNGINWMRENQNEIHPKGHATDLFTDWTLEYLDKQTKQKKPFFLFLTYNAPHDPIQPPNDWLDKVRKRAPNLSLKRQKLVALVEHLDHNIGRVINQVENSKLNHNTIIIITSDNGGALQYGASNFPFSGGKGDFLEGGIRIPCVVKLPDSNEHKLVNKPLLLMDFFPTLIQYAGGNSSYNLPSKSISFQFTNESQTSPRTMIWVRREGHKFSGQDYYAISNGQYKLLQRNPFSEYELFDLKFDYKESQPIENVEMKNILQKQLTKHIQKSGLTPWQ